MAWKGTTLRLVLISTLGYLANLVGPPLHGAESLRFPTNLHLKMMTPQGEVPCAQNVRYLDYAKPANFAVQLGGPDVQEEESTVTLEWTGPTSVTDTIDGMPYVTEVVQTSVAITIFSQIQVNATPAETPEALIAQLLQQRAAFVFAGFPYSVSSVEKTNVSIMVEGGIYHGKGLTNTAYHGLIRGDYSSFAMSNVVHDFYAVCDWGYLPAPVGQTNRQFVILEFRVQAAILRRHPSIDFGDAANRLFRQPSVEAFASNLVRSLAGSMKIRGAVPEHVFLYDFSGANGVSPDRIPRTKINQYDAGQEEPSLPVRFTFRGGNACGPTALRLALAAFGVTVDTVSTAFANTMTEGVSVTEPVAQVGEFKQDFDPERALAWISGRSTHGNRPFSPTLTTALRPSTGTLNVAGWKAVEREIKAGFPVLVSTTLSARPDPTTTEGHVLALLGIGSDERVTNALNLAYPGTTAYYIVADPAGHYYANPTNGTGPPVRPGENRHFGKVTDLQAMCIGVSYGGRFAIYPREELQRRTLDYKSFLRFRAEREASAQVRSPATLMVRDSQGRQTGILEDGTVFSGIPGSWFSPEVTEEFEGERTVHTNGIKTVVLDLPREGVYTVELVGTGSGPYEFEWRSVGANGAAARSQVVSGTIVPGQRVNYTFTHGPAIADLLRIPAGGFEFNLHGETNGLYLVQSSSDLQAWSTITTVTATNGTVRFANPGGSIAPKTFFRALRAP